MTCIAVLQGTGGACMLAAQSYFQEPACAHKRACLLLGLLLARLGNSAEFSNVWLACSCCKKFSLLSCQQPTNSPSPQSSSDGYRTHLLQLPHLTMITP